MPRRHVPDGGVRNEIFAAADVQEAPRRYRIVLLADAQRRLEFAAKDLGIAVGGQAHGLRSIVVREAKMTAHHLPQEAERVRIVEGFDGQDTRANGLRQRSASYLADPVDGEDGRAIEA